LTGLVGLLGVILGVLLGKALERFLDLRRRRDRQVDMVFALHAEIAAGLGAAAEQTAPAERDNLLSDEWPFGPSDRTDFVFENLKADVSILPQAVIHSTVRYYRLAEQSNRLVEFLDDERYGTLRPDERRRYALNILDKLREQTAAGQGALDALEAFMARNGLEAPKRSPGAQTSGLIGPDMANSIQ